MEQKFKHGNLSKHTIVFVYLFNYISKKSWETVTVPFENEAIARYTCPKKQAGYIERIERQIDVSFHYFHYI
jgi:hypothetical protein